MKQTAVEWLIEAMYQETYPFNPKYSKIFEQAKEMEKEQIETAFEEGMFHHTNGLCPDEYCNETFKQ